MPYLAGGFLHVAAGAFNLHGLRLVAISAAAASFGASAFAWMAHLLRAGGGSFSPDGTQVAYASAGDDAANWDIWLKLVGDTQGRRLTTDPAGEHNPAWSPDGTEMAFVRLRTWARSSSMEEYWMNEAWPR